MDLRTLELTIASSTVRWVYSYARELDLDARTRIDGGEHELAIRDRDPIVEHLVQIRDLLSAARGVFDSDVRDNVDDVLERTVKLLGEHLHAALFERASTDLTGSLDAAFTCAARGEFRLCLELVFEDRGERLASWPWEFLYSPGQRNYVALMANVAVTRANFAKLDKQEFPVPRNELDVLVVVARPRSLPPVDGSRVIATLSEVGFARAGSLIEPVQARDEELAVDYSPVASWAAFEETIRARDPHVVHFIGHGRRTDGGQLAFVGDDGDSDWVKLEVLARVIRDCKRLRLLLLQACELARPDTHSLLASLQTQMARRELPPSVIAMQGTVTNDDADRFASELYRQLAATRPGTIAEAVRCGRLAMNRETLGFGIPVVGLWSYRSLLAAARVEKDSAKRGLVCPACGKNVDEHDRFCGACSYMLVHDCGARLSHPPKSFCTQCGKPLAAQAEPVSFAAPSAPPGGAPPLAASPSTPNRGEGASRPPWEIR